MKVVDRPYTPEAVAVKPQTTAEVGLLVYLSGPGKIKPPTGSGRRERISIHHDELITGVDFFFSVQIFFNIEGVFGVVVGGQLVVGMLGQVVLVRKKWSDTTQLQNALAAVQHRQQLLPGAASIRQL